MKHILLVILTAGLLTGCKGKQEQQEEATQEEMSMETMETEESGEWIVLFDGTSFDDWKGYLSDSVPEHWKLEDGAMVFYPPENRPEGAQYNLVTKEDFGSFVLSLEWQVSEGANSGILWGIKEDAQYHQPYETGPEIQVLDNERHPDAKAGTTHQAGALYDMVAPAKDVTRPVGEWNSCVITVDYEAMQGSVELNGEKILDFPVANEQWNTMVAGSKFADWEGFGKFPEGKIGLQDHGDKVAFRNIRIKKL